MSFVESLEDARESLAARKLRSALSMLGMIFGVGAVIAMLAIGEGAEGEALALIERLGIRNVVVEAKDLEREDLQEIRKKSPGLSPRDLAAIAEAVPGVESAVARIEIEPYRVSGPKGRIDAAAYGVSREYFTLSGFRLKEGRFLDLEDERAFAQVAMIGSEVERALFGYESGLGQALKLDDVWLEVVGVLEGDGDRARSYQGVEVSSTAREIYLPYSTALRKIDRPLLDSPLDQIVVQVEKGTSPWDAATAISPLLDLLHGGAEDFRVLVPEALLEQSRRTKRLFSIVMGAIAGISLLVGGIGIMNIMLASVLERTREIGVRRAVGARRRDIKLQFLVESFAISVAGGILGIAVGIAIAHGVALYADWRTVVTLPSVALATLVSVAVGVASGFYPATRASEIDPAEALGYE
ncbi:MAG TPA: ABC transporter permease [Vicinamibacteria bacterium]|nr:ABC transporter permease [Vicinamibacteria bacterium]